MVVVVVAPSSVIAASDVVGAIGRGINVERGRPVSGVRSCRGVDVDSRCPAWSRQLDVRPSVRDQNVQKEIHQYGLYLPNNVVGAAAVGIVCRPSGAAKVRGERHTRR